VAISPRISEIFGAKQDQSLRFVLVGRGQYSPALSATEGVSSFRDEPLVKKGEMQTSDVGLTTGLEKKGRNQVAETAGALKIRHRTNTLEAAMANIVIYSDGTGQRGGLLFDERRSNIYKLFRATRCGPDSSVDPAEQLTFYDPGLGTAPSRLHAATSVSKHPCNSSINSSGHGWTIAPTAKWREELPRIVPVSSRKQKTGRLFMAEGCRLSRSLWGQRETAGCAFPRNTLPSARLPKLG
jgi:Uncharacterized alpha/beta hydrolase domain (DUF2235)